MIKKEEKGDKVYIYVKDQDTGIEWTVTVDEEEFEWCVKKKEEAGFTDPIGSAMLDYALFDRCSIPKVTLDDVQKFLDETKGGG